MREIKYLLDTNIIIGLLKADPRTIALLTQYPDMLDNCAISQITRMELLGFPGIQPDDEQQISAFLDNCQVFLLDEATEIEAVMLLRTGNFRLPDATIAATAKINNLCLITLDMRFAKAWKLL